MDKVMISIKPEWVMKILNKVKTFEIRKSIPKCKLPCEVYIYCTKGNETLYRHFDNKFFTIRNTTKYDTTFRNACCLNGRVVAKFILDYDIYYTDKELYYLFNIKHENLKLLKFCCISESEFKKYARDSKMIHFWHISDLEIFKFTKDLGDFNLKRAPQSWCYIK